MSLDQVSGESRTVGVSFKCRRHVCLRHIRIMHCPWGRNTRNYTHDANVIVECCGSLVHDFRMHNASDARARDGSNERFIVIK